MEFWMPLGQATNTGSSIPPSIPPSGTSVGPVSPEAGGVAHSETGTQTVTGAPGGTGVGEKPKQPAGPLDFLGSPLILLVVVFGLMYLFMFRGQRKEEKNRKKMIEQMKKGDEVMTIGGLVGKVVEVKEDRVVLKVDESANVKETYLKSAIQRVITEEK